MSSTAPPPSAAETAWSIRNLAGKIMLRCGVRGMSKENGQLQDWVTAEIASALDSASRKAREEAERKAREETVAEAAKEVCTYCRDEIRMSLLAETYVHQCSTGCWHPCTAAAIWLRWPPAPRPPAEEK